MANRLSPAFSKHLKPARAAPADPALKQRQEEEAVRLAMSLHLQGRLRDAEQVCFKLLSRNPRNAKALYVVGRLALDIGDDDLAALYLERAIKESPREPQFLVALGEACRSDYESAIKHFRKALSLRPNMIEAMAGLALAYLKTDRADAALELWEKILRLDPAHDTALFGIADALTSLGRMDEAAAVLHESIKQRRAVGAAYNALANTRKFASEPPELGAILTELDTGTPDPNEASHLHHAAGKILNDLKRYEEAIDQFDKAKKISGSDFDVDAYRRKVERTIQVFSPALIKAKAAFGDPTDAPVFIVGMPRSGTTLTEQICASHPSVFGAGELTKLRLIAVKAGIGKATVAELRSTIEAMTPEQSRALAADYLSYVRKMSPTALRIIDKMPHNFEFVGLIALLFPNARIIHCRRDAIDNCVSCFVTKFNDKHGYNADLTKLGLYYREYDRLMRHWNTLLPGRIHEVRYEAMIADQETESRRLIEFLGLPWDDACLRFEENDRTVSTPSRWQVRQPLYQTSVKRWKNYGPKIQPLIDALGDLADV